MVVDVISICVCIVIIIVTGCTNTTIHMVCLMMVIVNCGVLVINVHFS